MNKEGSAGWREEHDDRMRRGVALMQEAARAELAGFLDRWRWQWYLTLTFRHDVHLGQAYRAWGHLMSWLRERNASPGYFRGVEWQRDRHVPHFHALVLGVDHAATRMRVVDWWFDNYGIARVQAYDARRGAVWYVGKYITKCDRAAGDWTLEVGGQKILKLRA